MKFNAVLFFVFLMVSQLAHALYGQKTASTYKAVVGLHLTDPENPQIKYFCSGVLIGTTKVLTAGHCIEVIGKELIEEAEMLPRSPELLKVKIAGSFFKVKSVTYSPTYSEFPGYEGEDLAIIELQTNVKNVLPLKLASLKELKAGREVILVAREEQVRTEILETKLFDKNTIIYTNGSKNGACLGDSGGAMLIDKNGETLLAGIISAQDSGCEKITGELIFPKAKF